ncbi:hypothetical protein Lal_00047327 [Lupinus albus]|nr:hypothetical protein Lal_00047327 [Lupinus albus]
MISSQHEWALSCRQRFGREASPSPRYYKSSIWHGIKVNWDKAMSNAFWLVGDGVKISFWKENWLGSALVDLFNILAEFQVYLAAKVADFVNQSTWTIPRAIAETYPLVVKDIVKFHIFNIEDKLIWMGTKDGVLSLREAFHCIKQEATKQLWCKAVWAASIPLSKSFTTWRLFHHKMPTDENLQQRGFGIGLVISSKSISIQAQLTLFYQPTMVIGAPRNQRRFEDKVVSLLQAKARIKLATTLYGNHSKLLTNNSVHNFIILREFNVKPNFPAVPSIKEVIWAVPLMGVGLQLSLEWRTLYLLSFKPLSWQLRLRIKKGGIPFGWKVIRLRWWIFFLGKDLSLGN